MHNKIDREISITCTDYIKESKNHRDAAELCDELKSWDTLYCKHGKSSTLYSHSHHQVWLGKQFNNRRVRFIPSGCQGSKNNIIYNSKAYTEISIGTKMECFYLVFFSSVHHCAVEFIFFALYFRCSESFNNTYCGTILFCLFLHFKNFEKWFKLVWNPIIKLKFNCFYFSTFYVMLIADRDLTYNLTYADFMI